MNEPNEETDVTSSRRLDRGTFAALLDRHEQRRSHRIAEFPPDFMHGEATLDEIYEAFGEEWVHGAAFVQHHATLDGRPSAVSVATFTDWFLTVEHLTLDDHDLLDAHSLNRWMRARFGERRVVVELQSLPVDSPRLSGSHWIDLHCSVARFLELERTVLRVHRDGAPDWATNAQTNLLSLIILCARLGVERLN